MPIYLRQQKSILGMSKLKIHLGFTLPRCNNSITTAAAGLHLADQCHKAKPWKTICANDAHSCIDRFQCGLYLAHLHHRTIHLDITNYTLPRTLVSEIRRFYISLNRLFSSGHLVLAKLVYVLPSIVIEGYTTLPCHLCCYT